MELGILLQQQTNINDIAFRTTDVVVIVGGVISILGSYFLLRFKSISTAEKLSAYILATDKEMEKLEKMIEKNDDEQKKFQAEIFKKLDRQSSDIHNVALSISEFKSEILQELNKK